MDDPVARTISTYEAHPEAYDYLANESIYGWKGGTFRERLDGSRVLDVGCGPGADLEAMADDGLDPVGVDLASAFLGDARDRVPSSEVLRGDMRTLPLAGGTVAGVWCSAALLHLPRDVVPDALAEFARVVRPGGPLYVSVKEGTGTRFRRGDHGDGRHFTLFEARELASMLRGAGFEVAADLGDPDWVSLVATYRA